MPCPHSSYPGRARSWNTTYRKRMASFPISLMRNVPSPYRFVLEFLFCCVCTFAQQVGPPVTSAAPAPLQIPHPHYITITESVDVNAPIDQVWKRVGKFCDI